MLRRQAESISVAKYPNAVASQAYRDLRGCLTFIGILHCCLPYQVSVPPPTALG